MYAYIAMCVAVISTNSWCYDGAIKKKKLSTCQEFSVVLSLYLTGCLSKFALTLISGWISQLHCAIAAYLFLNYCFIDGLL